MLQISREDALKRTLPKWPQCLITGPAVTIEQAKDIIFRTDTFLTSMSEYAGGNNHTWNKWAREVLGYALLDPLLDNQVEWNDAARARRQRAYDAWQKVADTMGFVTTEYLGNSWASCAYIFGPHGWCHPDGRIHFTDNVGKWPEVDEIVADLEVLRIAFPYLELWLTLMDGEQFSDTPKKPVVTMHLKDGQIDLLDGTLEPFEGVVHTRGLEGLARTARAMAIGYHSREQGLPDAWISELGRKTKPLIEKVLSE